MGEGVDASVLVIGLNPRGAALAEALGAAAVPVTAWDESSEGDSRPDFADPSMILVCVEDYASVQRVLDQAGPQIADADVVNLTSGTSAQAEEAAARTGTRGGHYLDGALMAHPEHVGNPDTVVVYSGSAGVFERHESLLRLLGGATYLGASPGTAALYDVAMLNFAWATLIGYLQTAALLATADVPATTVTPLLTGWLSSTVSDVITDYGQQIEDGRYPGEQEWLELDAPLMDHLIDATRERGLDTALPELIKSLTARSIDAGHGKDSFASLIETIRA
ncbi:NAD(P)-dependent oxidoreductase [Spirillospora sp. CA-294931]|uniref:NAD(P)-dependent oxidoreductase n=1 Tax=Spirillospora sp. CA-294931 TaxID=3240042 RepID=UPI003D89E127